MQCSCSVHSCVAPASVFNARQISACDRHQPPVQLAHSASAAGPKPTNHICDLQVSGVLSTLIPRPLSQCLAPKASPPGADVRAQHNVRGHMEHMEQPCQHPCSLANRMICACAFVRDAISPATDGLRLHGESTGQEVVGKHPLVFGPQTSGSLIARRKESSPHCVLHSHSQFATPKRPSRQLPD